MSVISNTQLQAIQLAEQINDEFLTCKICFEHYKEPKCLSCLHTFCEDCIEQHVNAQRTYKYTDYREFSCPICRKKTAIPSGGVRKLNDNFLVLSLNELLLSKRPSKIPVCDICKIVHQKEKEATSKCVECQKLMCRNCVHQHQQMKISMNHSVFELDLEKDIMCKEHPNEQVRFYCEACEVCVCVPCTYTEHRDHDLVDFKQGITHHKDTIEENLRKCRQKMGEVRNRLDLLRQCETHIISTQTEIRSATLTFIDAIRHAEHDLLLELENHFGPETTEYIKKKDDLESFLDQLKSTCNLTEMVVKGKDIEMLLLKKQLCEKFEEFQSIELEEVPKNILKRVTYIAGNVDLGKIVETETNKNTQNNKSGIAANISAKYASIDEEFNDLDDIDEENENEEEEEAEEEDKQEKEDSKTNEKCTQISHRDYRELLGERIKESEVQTDIRMIHDLVAPNRFLERTNSIKSPMQAKTDTKFTQTTESHHPTLTNQSSVEEDPSAPVDRNKLGRRVRRHVKPGCSIAVLPSSEIIIIDPESNCITILDRRGKFRFGLSNSNKPCTEAGHQPSSTQFGNVTFGNLPKLEKGVRIMTPQGTLIMKLENEQLVDTPNVALAVHAYDRMTEQNSSN